VLSYCGCFLFLALVYVFSRFQVSFWYLFLLLFASGGNSLSSSFVSCVGLSLYINWCWPSALFRHYFLVFPNYVSRSLSLHTLFFFFFASAQPPPLGQCSSTIYCRNSLSPRLVRPSALYSSHINLEMALTAGPHVRFPYIPEISTEFRLPSSSSWDLSVGNRPTTTI
jgi:hypothetical protein